MVAVGQDTEIFDQVKARRRHESGEAREEDVVGEVNVCGPGAGRLLERHAHAPVGALFDGVLDERRTKQILAETFELSRVTSIDSRGGVKLHAEARDGHGLLWWSIWERVTTVHEVKLRGMASRVGEVDAGEGYVHLVFAVLTAKALEAALEVSAGREGLELARTKAGNDGDASTSRRARKLGRCSRTTVSAAHSCVPTLVVPK